jgi:hypothetical protein
MKAKIIMYREKMWHRKERVEIKVVELDTSKITEVAELEKEGYSVRRIETGRY